MLTPKQQRFVAEYLVDLNATQAAIRCGYSVKTAGAIGHENLKKPEIAKAVQAGQAKQFSEADLSKARVIEEIRRIGLNDPRGFWDEAGNLKPIKDLSAEQAACLAGFEVLKKNTAAGDGVVDTIHKIKVWDKPKALELLAKHFGILKENVEITGELTISWQ